MWRLRGEQLRPVMFFAIDLDSSPGAITRAIIFGKKTPKGCVYLDGIRHSQKGWMTSSGAVRRFMDALANGPQEPEPPRSAA